MQRQQTSKQPVLTVQRLYLLDCAWAQTQASTPFCDDLLDVRWDAAALMKHGLHLSLADAPHVPSLCLAPSPDLHGAV